ncbi:hypothetical protein Droror1_Dr00006495 [Drosera rotundifolia]
MAGEMIDRSRCSKNSSRIDANKKCFWHIFMTFISRLFRIPLLLLLMLALHNRQQSQFITRGQSENKSYFANRTFSESNEIIKRTARPRQFQIPNQLINKQVLFPFYYY